MEILIREQKEKALQALLFLGLVLLILLLLPQRTWAQERELELAITQAGILTFGGQMPGTLIHLNEGDDIVVHLKNNTAFKHGVRWHGIYRADRDGSIPEVAKRFYSIQKAIEAGKTFTYRWKVEEPGTFWYHCHLSGNKYAGTHGAEKLPPAQSAELEQSRAQEGA